MRILELESKLERKLVRYAEATYDMLALKLTPAGQAGWMDRIFITKTGIHVYVEFKRSGKQLRQLQEYRRWQLQQRGCNVYGPVDDYDTGVGIIDYYGRLSIQETGVDTP